MSDTAEPEETPRSAGARANPPGGVRRRKIMFRVMGLAALIPVGLVVYTWFHYSPAAPVYASDSLTAIELPHRLRNSQEHDAARAKNGGNPYVLEIPNADRGAMLYYGASHVSDPSHPQVADIEARWQAFRPTAAVCEGRTRGYFYGPLIEPFAGLPEPALVHKLARRDGVRLYSLEPSYESEVEELIRSFPAEQIAMYFFLRVYASEAGGAANEELAADLLEKRTNVAGLRGRLPSLAAVDNLWRRDFADQEDWRVMTVEPATGYFSQISSESRRLRGEHMLRMLIDLANKGERVFGVVGSGHVIRQEWNLRTSFGMQPAWDQPKTSD